MIQHNTPNRHSSLTTHHSSLISTLLALALITSVALSCNLAKNLTGDPKAGTVSNLWPDVPPLSSATKADLEIPLGARLAIRAFMKGQINFIAFTTDQSASEVQDFYSNERMKAAGWTPSDKGCVGDSEEKNHSGSVCLFKRKDGKQEEGLAIIVGEDDKTKKTEVFYVRIELPEPTPSPNR
jgi:hypothetical protein